MAALAISALLASTAATATATATATAAGAAAATAAGRPALASAPTPGPAQAPEWWFDRWGLRGLWAAGSDGHGITVAVLDTGVQADLAELSGRVLAGANFSGANSPANPTPADPTPADPGQTNPTPADPTPVDGQTAASRGQVDLDSQPFSHGTAMASLIVAGQGDDDIEGVAPGAVVLPVVVPLAEETGDPVAPVGATAQAIRYAADHGAKVINMSFGALRYPDSDPDPCPRDIQDAVDYALTKGALLLAAAGNQGASGSPVAEPGVCLGVVSVGSVDSRLQVSSFSSRHPYLTLVAPGEQIPTLSRIPGHAFVGFGTSQATALAAAAIAVVWSAHPAESNAQILSRVLTTATDLGTAGHDSAYGYGFIAPAAAIAAAGPASSDNPVFDAVRPLLASPTTTNPAPSAIAAAGRSDAPLGPSTVGRAPAADRGEFWLFCAAAVLAFAVAAGLAWRVGSARRSHR